MAKKSRHSSDSADPHAAREAGRYQTPTASREYIISYLESCGAPATITQIAKALDITQPEKFEGLRRRLIAMTRDAQLICNRREQYGLPKKMNLIRGRIQGHKDGFGFVIPELGGGDLYLSSRQMRRVFDGDVVLVRKKENEFRGKTEAVIVEVLERNTHEVVGRFHYNDGVAFVIPDNARIAQDILVPEHAIGGAANGQYVTVNIVRQPELRTAPMGHVTEVLGEHMAPGMEIDVALRTHGIPFRWPDEIAAETAVLPSEVHPKETGNRFDLRDLPLITIDGEDARDFDDAVFCEKKASGGWRLFVAIADVSHYVKPGSALDKEAYQRGNSVYFPDHVVPMLPEVLSNGLCSLNPHADRACMVCEMTISDHGRMSSYKFYEGLMHSQARLTYDQVGQLLHDPDSFAAKHLRSTYPDLVLPIFELHHLYLALQAERKARGAIDFETVETRILFDEDRKIDQIVPVVRNDAHKLIEECMLCANVAAAKLLHKYKVPALYRVHEGPSEERLEKLRGYLGELSLSLGGGSSPAPKDFQNLCEVIKERPDAMTLQTIMLRSLSQATYTPEDKGHFGLGYKAYTHFTSPIRRYPDLLVHRAIRSLIYSNVDCKHVVRNAGTVVDKEQLFVAVETSALVVLGEHCSMTERRADEATRDVMSWLKCEYLTQHVGSEFDGIVTAVTSFGLFVELKGLYVEGLIHVSSLKSDYYLFDNARHRLKGERTGLVYKLGDSVRVQVIRVDLDDRKIDLELLAGGVGRKSRRTGRSAKREKILAAWSEEFERQGGAANSGKDKDVKVKKKGKRPDKQTRSGGKGHKKHKTGSSQLAKPKKGKS